MNELYGIFKNMSYDNHYENFTKSLNSAYATKETQKTMRYLTPPRENGTAHAGVLVIHEGVCYSTFIHNYGARDDNPFSHTMFLELAIFPLERAIAEDFDCEKDVRIVQFDTDEAITGGINATSTYVCNSLCVVDNILHITLGAQIDEDRFALYHTKYDITADTFTHANEVKIRYKDKTYPLDDVHLNIITSAEGYLSNASGMPQTTNRWSEYKGEYYTTFMIDGSPNHMALVIKTKDFDTMDFVSVIPDTEDGGAECASIIHTDQLYTACRQRWGTPYMIINRYDLENGTWINSYKIPDGNSRPWFFVWQDEVFLYNTIEEASRRYANISRIRTDRKAHNHKNAPMDTVATINLCGSYHSFYVYEDKIYFVCTFRGSMRFGELKLKLHDTEKVNDKLLELFGDL